MYVFMSFLLLHLIHVFHHLTKEHSGSGAAGLLHGQPGVLQGPVHTLEQLLLLGVHLLHLAVADTEELVVKLIEPGEPQGPKESWLGQL